MGYAFISYSSKDVDFARKIKNMLNSNGISTWIAPDDIPFDITYPSAINDAIKNCSMYILLLTESSQQSLWVEREFERAWAYNKPIIPIKVGDFDLNDDFEFLLTTTQILQVSETSLTLDESQKFIKAVRFYAEPQKIKNEIINKQNALYSQIIELQYGDQIQFCEQICDLLLLLIDLYHTETDVDAKISILYQIVDIYKLYWKNVLGYGEKCRLTANRIIETLTKVNDILDIGTIANKKVLFSAVAITIIYLGGEIRNDCIDTLTNGDVHGSQISFYIEQQEPFIPYLLSKEIDFAYSDDEIRFINDAKKKIITNKSSISAGRKEKKEIVYGEESTSDTDARFALIADYFSKANELFELIGRDKKANDFYSCLLTSYERLKNYCLEVGEKKVYSDCIIKISKLKQMISKNNEEKEQPSDAERGLKALLGLTLPKSGMYDVFISYHRVDEDRAQRVYNFLHKHLKEVFFDVESLPELSESDYELAIMNSLNHSKHFISIISDLETLEDGDYQKGDWVKREMRTFNSEIEEGRKIGSEFIILVSDEIFDKIILHNKENIHILWRRKSLFKFSEFESILAQYIV